MRWPGRFMPFCVDGCWLNSEGQADMQAGWYLAGYRGATSCVRCEEGEQ
jgi:hypothetical protein